MSKVELSPRGIPSLKVQYMPSKDTEYKVHIPVGITTALLRARDGYQMYMALVPDLVAGVCAGTYTTAEMQEYMLLPFSWKLLLGEQILSKVEGGLTLYFASPRDKKTIEILMWKGEGAFAGGIQLSAEPFSWDMVEPELEAEETANDSDKTITVSANQVWKILWTYIEFTTTATVGDRQIVVYLLDSADDIIYATPVLNVQPASVTEYYILLPTTSLEGSKENVAKRHFMPLPLELELKSSFKIQVLDSQAVDAAADDMVIQMMVKKKRVK